MISKLLNFILSPVRNWLEVQCSFNKTYKHIDSILQFYWIENNDPVHIFSLAGCKHDLTD